jgi:hypothetical protein
MFKSLKEVSVNTLRGLEEILGPIAYLIVGVFAVIAVVVLIIALQAGVGALIGLVLSWTIPSAQVWLVTTTGFGLPTAGAIVSVVAGMFKHGMSNG